MYLQQAAGGAPRSLTQPRTDEGQQATRVAAAHMQHGSPAAVNCGNSKKGVTRAWSIIGRASRAPAGVHHSKLPEVVRGCRRHVGQVLHRRTRGQRDWLRLEVSRPLQQWAACDGEEGEALPSRCEEGPWCCCAQACTIAHSRAGLRVPSRLRKCQSHLQIVEDVLGDVAPSVVLPVGVLLASGHKAARGTYPLAEVSVP